jgi:hypothetical protein
VQGSNEGEVEAAFRAEVFHFDASKRVARRRVTAHGKRAVTVAIGIRSILLASCGPGCRFALMVSVVLKFRRSQAGQTVLVN